jgi:hypothetical protein
MRETVKFIAHNYAQRVWEARRERLLPIEQTIAEHELILAKDAFFKFIGKTGLKRLPTPHLQPQIAEVTHTFQAVFAGYADLRKIHSIHTNRLVYVQPGIQFDSPKTQRNDIEPDREYEFAFYSAKQQMPEDTVFAAEKDVEFMDRIRLIVPRQPIATRTELHCIKRFSQVTRTLTAELYPA